LSLGFFQLATRRAHSAVWLLVISALLAMPLVAESKTRASKATVNAKKKLSTKVMKARALRVAPARPSFGQIYGLHKSDDALDLKSSVALVLDQDTNEVLFSKNPQAVLPIASITKLMTALVVSDAKLPLDDVLTISAEDVDTEKGSRSKLRVGTALTREEMLHLALMASENRAAHALGRHYPGGLPAFVDAMNRKADALGMTNTHYVEPTGLSSRNQSSARDLALLVKAAYEHPTLREYSTSPDAAMPVGRRMVQFRNTNSLVRSPIWEIGLQKTGYISEAGRCLVMQAQLAGRKLIMVLLDSTGRYTRIGDAERIRRWMNNRIQPPQSVEAEALPQRVESLSAAVSEGSGDLSRSGSDSF